MLLLFGVMGVMDMSIVLVVDLVNVFDLLMFVLFGMGMVMINCGLGENDGFVLKCSVLYGKVLSMCYKWNYIDEIN